MEILQLLKSADGVIVFVVKMRVRYGLKFVFYIIKVRVVIECIKGILAIAYINNTYLFCYSTIINSLKRCYLNTIFS